MAARSKEMERNRMPRTPRGEEGRSVDPDYPTTPFLAPRGHNDERIGGTARKVKIAGRAQHGRDQRVTSLSGESRPPAVAAEENARWVNVRMPRFPAWNWNGESGNGVTASERWKVRGWESTQRLNGVPCVRTWLCYVSIMVSKIVPNNRWISCSPNFAIEECAMCRPIFVEFN
jgi:hypothetical protein